MRAERQGRSSPWGCAALILALALLGAPPEIRAGTAAQAAAGEPALEARLQALAAELRCLVCQNESLADSRAPLAVDLRREIREQLASGRSEAEVLEFLVARYGDFVLYRPPWKATTVLLWLSPALLLAGGLAWLVLGLRRHRRRPAPALTLEERQLARSLLEEQPMDGEGRRP